ncbi:hypothetical protein HMI54_005831 [Coelomomyces lativittatus]|nr:hypothetical protein HMI54_005831 [Coelomomyces lativittatus]
MKHETETHRCMISCNIDFTPHSIRGVVASYNFQTGIDIYSIFQAAHWSNADVFFFGHYLHVCSAPCLNAITLSISKTATSTLDTSSELPAKTTI